MLINATAAQLSVIDLLAIKILIGFKWHNLMILATRCGATRAKDHRSALTVFEMNNCIQYTAIRIPGDLPPPIQSCDSACGMVGARRSWNAFAMTARVCVRCNELCGAVACSTTSTYTSTSTGYRAALLGGCSAFVANAIAPARLRRNQCARIASDRICRQYVVGRE